MRVSCAILFVLSMTVQLAASLCPELQDLLSKLPADYMYDKQYARDVLKTLNELNSTHIWPEPYEEPSLLYKDDEDRPIEHDVVIFDRETYQSTFFGENPTEVPWVIFSCQEYRDIPGQAPFVGRFQFLAALYQGTIRFACMPFESDLFKKYKIQYGVMSTPFVHVLEPMADGSIRLEEMYVHGVEDLITFMDFITNERDLRYQIRKADYEVKPFGSAYTMMLYQLEYWMANYYVDVVEQDLLRLLASIPALNPYWENISEKDAKKRDEEKRELEVKKKVESLDFSEDEQELTIEGEKEIEKKLEDEEIAAEEEKLRKQREEEVEAQKKPQEIVDEEDIAEYEAAQSYIQRNFTPIKNNIFKWSGLDIYFMVYLGPFGRVRVLGIIFGVTMLTVYAIYGLICYKLCNCLFGRKSQDDDEDEKKNQ